MMYGRTSLLVSPLSSLSVSLQDPDYKDSNNSHRALLSKVAVRTAYDWTDEIG